MDRCNVGIVWPGESVFPDFTLTSVREWWGGLYKDFVGMGAAGFWNDMNEPALFQRADKTMQLDVVHRLDDGTTLDHRAIHNIYGMQNVRATYDGYGASCEPLERTDRIALCRCTRSALFLGRLSCSRASAVDNQRSLRSRSMSHPMSGYPDALLGIGAHSSGFAGLACCAPGRGGA